VLSDLELREIDERLENLTLEGLPQLINVDIPALLEEVRALQSMLFIRRFLSGGTSDAVSHGGQDRITLDATQAGSADVPVWHVGEGGGGRSPLPEEHAVQAPEIREPVEGGAEPLPIEAPSRPDRGDDLVGGEEDSGLVDG
jgi:hypothetical protein